MADLTDADFGPQLPQPMVDAAFAAVREFLQLNGVIFDSTSDKRITLGAVAAALNSVAASLQEKTA